MPSITLLQPQPDTNVTAALHSSNYSALQTLLNGGLDDANIASLSYSKLVIPSGSITVPKLAFTGTPSATTFARGDGVWAAMAGSLIGLQVFTASGTYTPATGATRVFVECIGGGGSGASVGTQGGPAGGGGGGAYSAAFLTTGFSGASYTVGAGGASPAAGVNAGNVGGDSSFGAGPLVLAKGGLGGIISGGTPTPTQFAQARGGDAATGVGNIKLSGGGSQGAAPGPTGGAAARGGAGGVMASVSGTDELNGNPGQPYGGGGSGAIGGPSVGATAMQGGAGAAGVICVWEYA